VSVKKIELEQKLILLSKCNECSHDDICWWTLYQFVQYVDAHKKRSKRIFLFYFNSILCQTSHAILHEFSLLTFMMRIIYCSQHAINQFSLFIFQFLFSVGCILIKIHFAFFFIASSEEREKERKKKCWKIYESSFYIPVISFRSEYIYTLHYLWDFFKHKFTRGMKWIEVRAI
jgi:hypothetical protein